MVVDAQALYQVLSELYPRELAHAVAETRARQAEARLAELEAAHDQPSEEESAE